MHRRSEKIAKRTKRRAVSSSGHRNRKLRRVMRSKERALQLGMPTLWVVATHGFQVLKPEVSHEGLAETLF